MNGYHNARLNRTTIVGTFKALKEIGVSHDQHLRVMRETKDRIRNRDAEPAAWFTGPTRAMWVIARNERGELDGWTHAEIGRALMGVSHA